MILAEWLAKNRISVDQFARHCGVSLPTIYKVLNNKKVARMSAYRIKMGANSEIDLPDIWCSK